MNQQPNRPEQRDAQRQPEREPRKQRHASNGSRFEYDHDKIPAHMTYQWNLVSVTGNEEIVKNYSIHMARNHWRPVPAKRHPELSGWSPGKTSGEEAIIIGGQVLCEREAYLTEEARDEDMKVAYDQVGQQWKRFSETPNGTAPRQDANGRSLAKVSKTYDRSIPE